LPNTSHNSLACLVACFITIMGPVFLIAYDSRIAKDKQLIAKNKFSNIVRGPTNSTSHFLKNTVPIQPVSLRNLIETVAHATFYSGVEIDKSQKSSDIDIDFSYLSYASFMQIFRSKFKNIAVYGKLSGAKKWQKYLKSDAKVVKLSISTDLKQQLLMEFKKRNNEVVDSSALSVWFSPVSLADSTSAGASVGACVAVEGRPVIGMIYPLQETHHPRQGETTITESFNKLELHWLDQAKSISASDSTEISRKIGNCTSFFDHDF